MYEGRKTALARFRDFSIPVLAILVLCIGLFSTAALADWAQCVRAWLDGANAVRLLVMADEKGTVTFTIGENVITFAVRANVELDTGRLRIDDAKSVLAELKANDVVTARCTIPIEQLTARDKTFCCDDEGPTITVSVDPSPGIGGWINRRVTITITAEDASGIAEIVYQSPIIKEGDAVRIGQDRLTLSNNGRTAQWRVELTPKYTPGGSHVIECWAIDTAGNVSERRGVELLLDFSRPLIDITVTPSADAVTVSWGITDTPSGVSECRIILMANGVEHVLSTSATGQRTLSTSEYGAGSHEVRVWAIDQAGNEISDSRAVTLTAQTCTIRGTVVDKITLQPLSGVTVTLYETGEICLTDNQGQFAFTGIDPGSYTIKFTKVGYELYRVGGGDRGAYLIEYPQVLLEPVEPAEPSISLSWTPDPADSSNEMTVGIDDLVYLYVHAPEGSACYFGFENIRNRDFPRAIDAGVTLGLSRSMRVEPADACLDPLGCEYSVAWLAGVNRYTAIDLQAYAYVSGKPILMSEVLTLYIQY